MDGMDLNELDPSSVRRKIGYLPQHGVLFNGTILENLTMFKPELEDKALRMARLLGLDDVVARMPLGYDTQVGNGAYDSLPRGIKQRVAIARALMVDPVVLLFDEANAAMDSAGDRVLTEFLEQARGKRTLILVSHRPSLLKMADEIYDLNNGALQKREPQPPRTGGAGPEQAAEQPQIIQQPTSAPKPAETPTRGAQPPQSPPASKPLAPEDVKPVKDDTEVAEKVKTVKSKIQVIPPKGRTWIRLRSRDLS